MSLHQIVASACRNDYLIVAVRDIRVWMAPALDLLDSSPVRRQESLDSHGLLIDCLRAGDRAGAGEAMRAHIGVTEQAVPPRCRPREWPRTGYRDDPAGCQRG